MPNDSRTPLSIEQSLKETKRTLMFGNCYQIQLLIEHKLDLSRYLQLPCSLPEDLVSPLDIHIPRPLALELGSHNPLSNAPPT